MSKSQPGKAYGSASDGKLPKEAVKVVQMDQLKHPKGKEKGY